MLVLSKEQRTCRPHLHLRVTRVRTARTTQIDRICEYSLPLRNSNASTEGLRCQLELPVGGVSNRLHQMNRDRLQLILPRSRSRARKRTYRLRSITSNSWSTGCSCDSVVQPDLVATERRTESVRQTSAAQPNLRTSSQSATDWNN